MRAIDADALIADCQLAQKQADRHGREFANAFYSCGGEVSTEWWCVEDMIENAPTIEPQQRWIPCSERLPKRGKDVLVTRDYDGREDNNKSCRYVEVASCYGADDDITWCSFSDEYKMKPRNHHVIAWMPLPEPYREGEGC